MTSAAILSIGDELLLGQAADTNASWLSQQLAGHGVLTVQRRTVGDDRPMIVAALRELSAAADIVVVTGGLGPTLDDLTRLAMTDVLDPGEEPVEDADALRAVEAWFAGRGRSMPPGNRLQALRPRSARMLGNPHGTAPGLAGCAGTAQIFCLPGPPREMVPMFDRFVRTQLPPIGPILTASIRCAGIGESDAAQRLGPLMRRDQDVLVGTTASGGIVTARIRAQRHLQDASAPFNAIRREVEAALRPYAFGCDNVSLASVIGDELVLRGATIVTCESCTGGAIGRVLTEEAGASRWYAGGWITYSNEAKERDLGVPAELLDRHGAMSREVAAAMAEGGLRRSGAQGALAVTGIAGPDGGSADKPVGTVFIGCAWRSGDRYDIRVRRFRFPGERSDVRERTALLAMQMMRFEFLVEGAERARLLWEHES